MTFASALANRLSLAAAAPARACLERALRDPAAAQRAILARIVAANADSEFGRAHGFAGIASPHAYARAVPPRDFDAFAGHVERIAAGEPGVLTAEPVRFVEPTGGSSGPSKLVPYTASLLGEFSAATMAWVCDLLWHRPALRDGRAYWAITPPGRRQSHTAGGIRVGADHDSDYFPAFLRALLDRVLGVPRELAAVPDIAACRYLTLRALLGMPDLAFISVWNPSFLTLLASALDEHFDALLHDLEHGSPAIAVPDPLRAALARALPPRAELARAIRRRFGRTVPDDLGALWPRLALISCWTDGHARRALDGMRRRFPNVEVQGKGLLATEGVVSIPLLASGAPVAAVTSHFLEFIPEHAPDRTLLVDALEPGGVYEVMLTTSGGLYRYRVRDLVRVEGFVHRTPILSFHGRADRASDLAGEKLTPAFVERALERAADESGVHVPFALLAPVWGEPPWYDLFVDAPASAAARLAHAMERTLGVSHHYRLCRALGQLGPVRAVSVPGAERRYERVCVARGQRAGVIKPPVLAPELGWDRQFDPAADQALGTAATGS